VQLERGRKRTSSSSFLFRQEGDRSVPPRRRWSIRSAARTDAECHWPTRDHLSSCRPRGGAPLTNLCPFHQPEVAATQPRAPRRPCRPRRPPAAATTATLRPLPPTARRASPSGGRASSVGGHAAHGCGAQSPLRPLLRPRLSPSVTAASTNSRVRQIPLYRTTRWADCTGEGTSRSAGPRVATRISPTLFAAPRQPLPPPRGQRRDLRGVMARAPRHSKCDDAAGESCSKAPHNEAPRQIRGRKVSPPARRCRAAGAPQKTTGIQKVQCNSTPNNKPSSLHARTMLTPRSLHARSTVAPHSLHDQFTHGRRRLPARFTGAWRLGGQ